MFVVFFETKSLPSRVRGVRFSGVVHGATSLGLGA
jgi:hypothetical protein